jgi:hypothetical protein
MQLCNRIICNRTLHAISDIIVEDLSKYMRNLLFLIALLLIVSSFGGLAEPSTSLNMNTTALKELVINSENNLKSYSLTFSENEDIKIVNSTSGNTTSQVNIQTLGAGAINRTSKSAKIVFASLIMPIGDVVNASTISEEVYYINDTLYSKVDGNWTTMKLALPVAFGTNQDMIRQTTMLLNASTIRLVGIEAINGERYYVVEVSPQSSVVSSYFEQELGSISSMIPQSIKNISHLFNNTQLRYVLWINTASNLPEQAFSIVNITTTPGMLGYPGGNSTEIYINSSITTRFSDLNKTINIVLPEASKRAEMLPLNNSGTSAAIP